MLKKKRYVTIREYKKLRFILNRVLEHQDNIIKTIKTLTSFTPTEVESVDTMHELVKVPDPNSSGRSTTEKRRRRSSKHKNLPTLEEVKRFFHGKGYEVIDDGKKPVKIMHKGHKRFVVQRKSVAIFKHNRKEQDPKLRYTKVFLEDLV
jgi:hypothetical protein